MQTNTTADYFADVPTKAITFEREIALESDRGSAPFASAIKIMHGAPSPLAPVFDEEKTPPESPVSEATDARPWIDQDAPIRSFVTARTISTAPTVSETSFGHSGQLSTLPSSLAPETRPSTIATFECRGEPSLQPISQHGEAL